jgi:hypothetical protein
MDHTGNANDVPFSQSETSLEIGGNASHQSLLGNAANRLAILKS